MKSNRTRNIHATLAQTIHEHAARLHIEAAKHYVMGKDYAHAAHQALAAHGHALFALAQGQKVTEHYRTKASVAIGMQSTPLVRSDLVSVDPSGPVQSGLHAAQHHEAAAQLHEHAARFLRQATKHYEHGEVALAAHEAQAAHAISLCAIDQSNEAAKHHAMRCFLDQPVAQHAVAEAA
jgi:hypothetical protein